MDKERTLYEKIINSKITPVLLLLLTIDLFFNHIPEHIQERFDIFLAIFGGAITLFLSVWAIETIAPVLFDKIPTITALFCISTLFIFGIMLISKTSSFHSGQLKDNGVLTEAILVKKTKIYGKGFKRAYHMKVRFMTEDNKDSYAKILLSRWEYERFDEGEKIPIYYSSEHPNIARIAHDKLKPEEPDFLDF